MWFCYWEHEKKNKKKCNKNVLWRKMFTHSITYIGDKTETKQFLNNQEMPK